MTQITKRWVFYTVPADSPKGYARYLVAGPPQTNDDAALDAAVVKAQAKVAGQEKWAIETETITYDDAEPPVGQEREFSYRASFEESDGRKQIAVDKAEVDAQRSALLDRLKERVKRA